MTIKNISKNINSSKHCAWDSKVWLRWSISSISLRGMVHGTNCRFCWQCRPCDDQISLLVWMACLFPRTRNFAKFITRFLLCVIYKSVALLHLTTPPTEHRKKKLDLDNQQKLSEKSKNAESQFPLLGGDGQFEPLDCLWSKVGGGWIWGGGGERLDTTSFHSRICNLEQQSCRSDQCVQNYI